MYFVTNEYASSGDYLWLFMQDGSRIVLFEDGSDNNQSITYLYGFVDGLPSA